MSCMFRTIEGEPVAAPLRRSFAVLRRASIARAKANGRLPYMTGKEAFERRAYQYVMAMMGLETPHGNLGWVAPANKIKCVWDVAPDGSKRVRSVLIGGHWHAIPHWDFTPEEPIEALADE